jgi:hypothetical protein
MSWRALLRRLDEPRDVKRAVYRGHRIVGLALFAGALYALDWLWFTYQPGTVARVLRSWGNGELDAVLLESLWLFLLGGNVAALAAALVVVFRPSLLKGLERWADRIYGARNSS